jgi:hypothetical protein
MLAVVEHFSVKHVLQKNVPRETTSDVAKHLVFVKKLIKNVSRETKS